MKGFGLIDLEEIHEAAATAESFICSYRRPHLYMAIGCFVGGLAALWFPLQHYRQFHTLSAVTVGVGGYDQMPYASLFFGFFGLMFVAWAVYFGLSSFNQSISVMHGVIVWRGVTGRVRLQCLYGEVESLSLRQSWHKNGYSCEVRTLKGPLRWDSNISSSGSLLRVAKLLAQQNDLFG